MHRESEENRIGPYAIMLRRTTNSLVHVPVNSLNKRISIVSLTSLITRAVSFFSEKPKIDFRISTDVKLLNRDSMSIIRLTDDIGLGLRSIWRKRSRPQLVNSACSYDVEIDDHNVSIVLRPLTVVCPTLAMGRKLAY